VKKENWNKIEEMIEPLSPPKLLYFDQEKVISYEEEAEKNKINSFGKGESKENNKKPRIRK